MSQNGNHRISLVLKFAAAAHAETSNDRNSLLVCVCVCVCVYIYIYIFLYLYLYIYIYQHLRVCLCIYRSADKSLARPTSQCIFFDGENISFDARLVIYINSTNISPIMIIDGIYENQSSVAVVCFLPGRAKDLSAPQYLTLFLYYDQQMHNYITNYHTATCFDTIVSSAGSL
jgi:hypothetical protein